MTRELTQLELLRELESVAEANVNRHLKAARDWNPHDYVPWDEGRNFAALGGVDYEPEQSRLSDVAQAAMITNLLTEGQSAVLPPGDRRQLLDGLGVGLLGAAGPPRRTGTASPCATTSW